MNTHKVVLMSFMLSLAILIWLDMRMGVATPVAGLFAAMVFYGVGLGIVNLGRLRSRSSRNKVTIYKIRDASLNRGYPSRRSPAN